VLHEACRQLARWRADLSQAAGLSMSVNVSARQLQDASLVEDVESALRESGIETASQLATLIELDCRHGQGFLLGRPAPADQLAEVLQAVSPAEVTVAARLARLQ
jgi:EAL domain-containing protein (putative c-di-GMP-specific phosphodiesterase class I)